MATPGALVNFLERKRVTAQGNPHTHTSADTTSKGKYFIGSDDLAEFYELYYDYVEVHRNKIWLIEAPTPLGPCRVDLDFLYVKGTAENMHTAEQISQFTTDYVQTLRQFLAIDGDVEVYVMEKKKPVPKREGVAGGVHILLPRVKTTKYIELAVREIMLTKMSIFDPLPLQDKEWGKVYDKSVASRSTGWTMYGSSKPHGLPYIVSCVFSVRPDGSVTRQAGGFEFNAASLATFCTRETDAGNETPMTDAAKEHFGNLPDVSAASDSAVRISGGRAMAPSRGRPVERRAGPGTSRASSPNAANSRRQLTAEEQQNIREHVHNLDIRRTTEYQDWIEVGQCLKNIHPDLYDEFEEFSRRSDKFNLRECMSKWNSFSFINEGQKLTLGSLLYWSRMDNPERYLEIEKDNIMRKIDASRSAAEFDVASVVYSKFRDTFKCVSFGKNVWYKFTGHVWEELDKGVQLQQEFSTEIWRMYRQRATVHGQRMTDLAGTCDAKEPRACGCDFCAAACLEDDLQKVAKKLKTTAFKTNVMKECSELFLDETFTKRVDENRYLLACRNGVFDMNTCEFRDGKPEDYLSFSTKLDVSTEMTYRDYREWPEIHDFLQKVLPDPEVREYTLVHMSKSLNGVGNQKFHILTGSGSNGKSMLINLMETALGDYACKVPISLITQGRNKSASAAPEVVRLKGRRFVSMQEPDDAVPINTGLMKELTSSEKILARDLFAGSKAMAEFELQCKFHLACNDKPKVNTNDGGTWRRFVVINFISKFVAAPDGPNQFRMDTSIERKVKSEEWGRCFLAYLIHLYRESRDSNLVPPDKVLEYTKEYREENNAITKFIGECTRPSAEGEEVIAVRKNGVTEKFKTWWETNRGTRDWKVPEMFKEIEVRYGKYTYGGWKTFQMRDDVD